MCIVDMGTAISRQACAQTHGKLAKSPPCSSGLELSKHSSGPLLVLAVCAKGSNHSRLKQVAGPRQRMPPEPSWPPAVPLFAGHNKHPEVGVVALRSGHHSIRAHRSHLTQPFCTCACPFFIPLFRIGKTPSGTGHGTWLPIKNKTQSKLPEAGFA